MKVLTTVLVGSRLHGLATPRSDYDWRGIHIHDLKEVLSPFKKVANTSWIEGDEDNTSYELSEFCKFATKGNATILEVFFSNSIKSSTRIAKEMRENWQKFIDTDAFVLASRGYAHNQYNKMQMFEPDVRTPKFAVAYIRVLWQCAIFLETGRFPCQIDDEGLRAFMLEVKTTPHTDFQKFVPKLTEMFMKLQARVTDAYANPDLVKLKPDYEWIEDFIYRAYTSGVK